MHLLVCDRNTCPAKKHMTDEDDFDGWRVVHAMSDDETLTRHYCSTECLVLDQAGHEIPDTIPNERGLR